MNEKDKKLIMKNIDKEGIPDDETPEWSDVEFRTAKRGLDGLAELVGENIVCTLRKAGRPKVMNPKKNGTLRLSHDLWETIKSSGRGYNLRVENILREAILQGKL